MFKTAAASAIAFFALLSAAGAEAAPQRVVSFNLCADQLVLALADPAQIAGLSPYAADPALSTMPRKGARYPRLDWNVESVVNLAPDLVLVGPSDRPTQALLAATGQRIVEVGLVADIASAERQARDIGAALGHPERGVALAQRIAQARARLAASARHPPLTAQLVQRGGYVEGPASLVADMLATAGLRPPPDAPAGFGGYVSLEELLVNGPDVLVLHDPPRAPGDQGALFITHPALLARYGPERRIELPERYTTCGGPSLVEGLDYLAGAVSRLR